jgi:hypothetical protein
MLKIMMMTAHQLVESNLSGETYILAEILPHFHFVHHKSHITRPGIESGFPLLEAGD